MSAIAAASTVERDLKKKKKEQRRGEKKDTIFEIGRDEYFRAKNGPRPYETSPSRDLPPRASSPSAKLKTDTNLVSLNNSPLSGTLWGRSGDVVNLDRCFSSSRADRDKWVNVRQLTRSGMNHRARRLCINIRLLDFVSKGKFAIAER